MLKEKLKMMNGVLENGNYQLGQFQFAVLFLAGFGQETPQQEAVLKGQEFQELKISRATGRFLPFSFSNF